MSLGQEAPAALIIMKLPETETERERESERERCFVSERVHDWLARRGISKCAVEKPQPRGRDPLCPEHPGTGPLHRSAAVLAFTKKSHAL